MLLQGNAKCYKEKSYHYQIYHCLKVKASFHGKLFQKEKIKYCYGFMPGNFQVNCGSMVSKNRQLLASTETPAVPEIWHMTYGIVTFHLGLFFALLPP